MIAIPLLLYHEKINDFDSQQAGTWLIYIAAVLTLWSMFYYLKAALPQVSADTKNTPPEH
jgi:CDP-diacylglycerol--glycerol-3-phosphate 3-phosphatidyltransferase/cardiolipin synthase